MSDSMLPLRDQILALNRWLEAVYPAPIQLSELLCEAGLDDEAITALRQQYLAAYLTLLQSELRTWLALELNERGASVLTRRFSLDGQPQSTLEQIAELHSVSRERIRQIEQRMIFRLRSPKRRSLIKEIALATAQIALGQIDAPEPRAAATEGQTPSAHPFMRPAYRQGQTLTDTLALFQAGHPPAAIAEQRSLTIETIYSHLARWIERNTIAIEAVIAPDLYQMIEQAIQDASSEADAKTIKGLLPDDVLYGQIACVRAHRRRVEAGASASATPAPNNE